MPQDYQVCFNMNYPDSLATLIHHFKMLPGIGEKSAERMAFSLLNLDGQVLDSFAQSIRSVKERIRRCKVCNNISDEEICDICKDSTRKKEIICVVSDPKNVYLFEKNAIFNGQYHVLDGLISLTNGVGPQDIKLDLLLDRVARENIEEIIIAVKPTVEGEATALYIAKKLENTNTVVSRIAHGVPMGADIDYIDSMTLETAIYNRNKIS